MLKDVSASHGEASLGELTLLQRGGGARGENGRPSTRMANAHVLSLSRTLLPPPWFLSLAGTQDSWAEAFSRAKNKVKWS